MPTRVKANPGMRVSCFGKTFVAISMNREMIRIFERVPNPGRSFSGIHNERTSAPIIRVDVPIESPLLSEIPCARTDHGAFPKPD
jgi:hypothetical protein